MSVIEAENQMQLEQLSELEWLESNGRGAYASTSFADCHTRRYHGLLVSSLTGLPGRYVLLSQLEATVTIDEQEYPLACNIYPGAVHPRGYQRIVDYGCEPCPYLVYDLDGQQLRREVIMLPDEDAVYIQYTLSGHGPETRIQLKPLLSFRDSHSLSVENMAINTRCKRLENGIRIQPYEGLPVMYLQYNQHLDFYPGPCWEQQVVYPREHERGFDDREDRFYPGIIEGVLTPEVPLVVRAGIENGGLITCHGISDELERRRGLYDENKSPNENLLRRQAAVFFSSDQDDRPRLLAGYPWFGAWGRDTMIAVPGLCLYNNQLEAGQDILLAAAEALRDGLLPNTFAGVQGEQAYNSIDAPLWFIWAVQEYYQQLRKKDPWLRKIYPAVKNIIEAYAGDSTGLTHCDEQGLISAGDATTQLTWMDARAWGRAVTPRYGYAVEINALWYNAMRFHLQLSKSLRRKPVAGLADKLDGFNEAFQQRFWMDDLGFCADSVNQFGPDRSLRPNQIFAVSLPHSPLDEAQQRHVVMAVERELLTPYGLRTLSPKHPDYSAHYQGSADERDAAYHQGTVWPWLIGAFATARLKVSADPRHRVRDLRRKLHRLFNDHVREYGVGSISEIFDGDDPHQARGCYAQAWSVAEVLRSMHLFEQESA